MPHKRLFGADGIRSSVDRPPLTPEGIAGLGRAFAGWLWERQPNPSILLGSDTRESSHRIKTLLSDSLLHRGVHVVDAGVIPTPGLSYLLARKHFFQGGVMVSASHNPIVENGLKFFDRRGCKLTDQDEADIEDRFFAPSPALFHTREGELIAEPDYMQQYARKLAAESRDWDLGRLHLLVDCANGAAYQVTRLVLGILRVSNTLVNALPNGANINHNAGSETVRQSPARMAEQLHQAGKDIGVALDGDGDRVVVVDRTGMMFDGDMLLAAFGYQFQQAGALHKSTVVTTPAANSGLAGFLRRHRVDTRVVDNGDKYVTAALMGESPAFGTDPAGQGGAKIGLGGEQIGHVIVHDSQEHVTGDGLRTALLLLRYLAQDPGATLRELAPGMRKYPQVKASVHLARRTELPHDRIHGLLEQEERVWQAVPDLERLECRPASTEPLYRIMLEARHTPVPQLAAHAYRLGETVQRHFERPDLPIVVLDLVGGGVVPRNSVE